MSSSDMLSLLIEGSFYIIPVFVVIISFVGIYSLGVRKSQPPSFSSLLSSDLKTKKKEDEKKKKKTVSKTPVRQAVPQPKPKPQAIVKPIKREKKREVEQFKGKVVEGEWVTVVSENARKKLKYQQKEQLKNEVAQKLVDKILGDTTLEVSKGDAEIILEDSRDYLTVKSTHPESKGKTKKEQKVKERKKQEILVKRQLSKDAEVEESSESIVKDKLTIEILEKYDTSQSRKEKKFRKISAKENLKIETSKESSKKVAEKSASQREQTTLKAPVAPSSVSTDITDESDPSEGEFKVVKKRKPRRE